MLNRINDIISIYTIVLVSQRNRYMMYSKLYIIYLPWAWLTVYFSEVKSKYVTFNNILKYIFEWSFPLNTVKIRHGSNNWLSQDTKDPKKELIMNYILLGRQITRSCWRELNKLLNIDIIKSKTFCIKSRIKQSSNVPKTVWQVTNSETTNKSNRTRTNFDN